VELDENFYAAQRLLARQEADSGTTDDEDTDDEEYVPGVASPRASHDTPRVVSSNNLTVIPDESQDCVEEEGNKRRRIEGGETSCSVAGSQGNDLTDIDGLFCPICMDVWTNNGEHHIWCIRIFFALTVC